MIDCTEPDSFTHNAFEFDFIHPYQGWSGGTLKSHHLRDGAASLYLLAALTDRGGCFGKVRRMGPASPDVLREYKAIMRELASHGSGSITEAPYIEDVVDYQQVDESFLTKGKRVVFNTRPAMSDMIMDDKVQIQPSFTTLEEKIFRTCRPYLPFCARSRVRIADQLAAALPTQYTDRADILFNAYKEPWYTDLCAVGDDAPRHGVGPERRTALYVLNLHDVALMNGVDLTVVFGLGGTQTLWLSEMLRGELTHLLDTPGFSMVEVVGPPAAKPAPPACELIDSMLEWDVEVLLEGVVLDVEGTSSPRTRPASRAGAPARKSMKRVRRQPSARHGRSDA